eukprot:CAMPEP_0172836518 /NCGR_PEP_ID=MMETSP1075-20121228/26533_1 /TAXON_ID=2916 /ORGANISM="Ceratium fusus, Strain PA161109" /LENGTH=610 /DNA_ID=CAMNT_0013679751 /DNA_START=426 /DNA_END=2258 /DNA_ORIENTATION=+
MTLEDHKAAPSVCRVQGDIADKEAWPEVGQVAVLAKHLCGHSTDLGIASAINLGERLSLLCLAPCCHATMSWNLLAPESQAWFEELGINDAKEFALLTDVIRLSRVGKTEAGRPTPCSKWRLREHIDPSEIETMGRLACRAIDESRLVRLRRGGLDVALIEYCTTDLTPDNVLILASPTNVQEAMPLIPVGLDTTCSKPANYGVLLELDPTAPLTMQYRLMSYLNEQQQNRFPSLQTVVPIADLLATRVPGLICSAAEQGLVETLVAELAHCPLIKRAVTRLLPFVDLATDTLTLTRDVVTNASGQDGPKPTFRVFSRPRQLEQKLCAAFAQEWLSPTEYTHALCVWSTNPDNAVETGTDVPVIKKLEESAAADGFNESMGPDKPSHDTPVIASNDLSLEFRYAVLPRQTLDMSDWAATRQADMGDRGFWRCYEVAARWPRRFEAAKAVALWTDTSSSASWVNTWADHFLPVGAATFELQLQDGLEEVRVHPAREGCGTGTGHASILLCDVCASGHDAIDMLRAVLVACRRNSGSPLAGTGTAVLRLRCGRKPRTIKQWLRDIAKLLEVKLSASRVELLHLLNDRDVERTAVFEWGSIDTKHAPVDNNEF